MLAAVGVVSVLVVLAGCTPISAPTAPTTTAPPTRTPKPTPTLSAPGELSQARTAEQALPFFTDTVLSVWGADAKDQGRAYVDALTAAGFDKTAMEVTEDETAVVGLPADSIQFSVRWGDECLVGQVGPAIGDPVIAILPGLATGGCLLGQTRPIDW